MVIQDDQSAPIIYNRAESRRAATDGSEVPSSSVGAYGNGRLWVASGSQYAAGDLVGSSSGDAYINRIDAVLKFTENDYLNEGGSFATPTNAGPITALSVMSALDTGVGEGDLIVFTRNSAFATTVPTDRTVWKPTVRLRLRSLQTEQFGNNCRTQSNDWWPRLVQLVRTQSPM
jgi:hypothetical protein